MDPHADIPESMPPLAELADPARKSCRLTDPLPCPFCGGTWILVGSRWSAICVDCGATGPDAAKFPGVEKAWNRRA